MKTRRSQAEPINNTTILNTNIGALKHRGAQAAGVIAVRKLRAGGHSSSSSPSLGLEAALALKSCSLSLGLAPQ
eukprot:CAMPEP_0206267158 /NCGR_PEP_ID=MMETSP0047_2-20121206/30991_1 /ASSEMBLY_ACC=CAM_ASM_000192 /TAXON_ID=195065 /ORGANISM="Chroomonas mesostigmatica_cf, Strain CCMP1168" /LENGTH=73 /DNA_ID=CAMNT_0053695325 /DNA_START=167 /DNA_END=388 /DNA_ORIENTATION=+